MIKNILPLLAIGFLIIVSSCNSTIYFTQEMRNNLNENKLKVEDVQFYVSRKIVLKRNLTYEETKIARGEIKFENGKYVEEIIIPKNTQGVAIDYKNNEINVAFERGNNRELKYVLNDENLYQITALAWENNYGLVKYDTLMYFIEPGGDKALLKVKNDNIYNFQKKKRIVKGRSVGR
jgi:hypothetical protein